MISRASTSTTLFFCLGQRIWSCNFVPMQETIRIPGKLDPSHYLWRSNSMNQPLKCQNLDQDIATIKPSMVTSKDLDLEKSQTCTHSLRVGNKLVTRLATWTCGIGPIEFS